jgi:hypothetical protein
MQPDTLISKFKVLGVDKKDIVAWSKRYDKDQGMWAQREQELGSKFRKNRYITLEELVLLVEWKFQDSEQKKNRVLEAITKNDPAAVQHFSSQAFNVQGGEDTFRMNSLTMINGVSPMLASVILAFFDPRNYGFFDVRVWRGLLGNEPPNMFTTQNYLKLLISLRKVASKHNLDARVIDKAYYKKSFDAR